MDLPQDYKRLKRLKPETAEVDGLVHSNFSEVFSDGVGEEQVTTGAVEQLDVDTNCKVLTNCSHVS